MSSKEKVETVFGRNSKYEIFRTSKSFGEKEYSIYKDGKLWKYGIDTLAEAVRIAEES